MGEQSVGSLHLGAGLWEEGTSLKDHKLAEQAHIPSVAGAVAVLAKGRWGPAPAFCPGTFCVGADGACIWCAGSCMLGAKH